MLVSLAPLAAVIVILLLPLFKLIEADQLSSLLLYVAVPLSPVVVFFQPTELMPLVASEALPFKVTGEEALVVGPFMLTVGAVLSKIIMVNALSDMFLAASLYQA